MSVTPPDASIVALMTEALVEGRIAGEKGEIPVGALIVNADGEVIARGRNNREMHHDPAGHAEIVAIRAAAQTLGDRILDGCTLVVTLEPCVMCAGVILAARVSRVIFGAWDDKAGAAGSVYDLLRDGRLPHPSPEVIGGVCEEQSRQLLRDFFTDVRVHRHGV